MSSMSTTCPGCELHLAVTAADLRIGQGYVRCGRCDKVFNALITLVEDAREPPVTGDVATGTITVPALEQAPAGPQAEHTGAEMVAAAFEPETPVPRPMNPPSDDMEVIETLATGTFETIVLEGEGVLQTEEMVDEAEVDQRLREIADQIAGQEALGTQLPEEAVEEAWTPEEPFPTPARLHWGWSAGAVALLLLLGAQMVHHYRHALAGQAWAQRILAPVYGLAGITLEPRWDLAAYDVRQLGGEAVRGATGRILLRASVLNRAAHPQPLPLLRVTLQDRFGNALSTHDVKPQDYLPGAPPARLAPDQRIDAEMLLEDAGSKAVGFELDACLPTEAGPPRCAAQP